MRRFLWLAPLGLLLAAGLYSCQRAANDKAKRDAIVAALRKPETDAALRRWADGVVSDATRYPPDQFQNFSALPKEVRAIPDAASVSPYDWSVACDRNQERSIEIRMTSTFFKYMIIVDRDDRVIARYSLKSAGGDCSATNPARVSPGVWILGLENH